MTKPFIINDREVLINLVRERTTLWDKTSEVYKDKLMKCAAWREICNILNEDFEQLSPKEKEDYGKCVITTWSRTRDSWVKSLNEKLKARKTGGTRISRPYIYHEQMLFLKKVVSVSENTTEKPEKSDSNETEENEADAACGGSNTKEVTPEPEKSAKRKKLSEIDEKMIAFINHQLRNKTTQLEDRHLLFFKSLQPSLALLNDDQTLEFQSGVISLLQNIKSGRSQESVPPQTTSYVAWEPHGFYRPPSRTAGVLRDSPSIESNDSHESDMVDIKFDVNENSQ